jgi:hypothetical protein
MTLVKIEPLKLKLKELRLIKRCVRPSQFQEDTTLLLYNTGTSALWAMILTIKSMENLGDALMEKDRVLPILFTRSFQLNNNTKIWFKLSSLAEIFLIQ